MIFSLCWLGEDWRVTRYQKYLEYYLKLQNELEFDRIILVDNASDMNLLLKLKANIYEAETKKLIHYKHGSVVDVYRYKKHLARTDMLEYPYCWRGTVFVQDFIKQNPTLEKIYFIDSDLYVLSKKLTKFMRELQNGNVSFRSKKYGFPEAALFVLCRDWFKQYCGLPVPSYTYYNNQVMEDILPFSEVREDFIGDRYGETRLKQTQNMDYYGQWDTHCPNMVFNMKDE